MDRADLAEKLSSLIAERQHQEAVQLAVEGYGPEIRRFLADRLGASDAAEAYSMFCEDLVRNIESFRGECPLEKWLHTLARNAAKRWQARWHPRLGQPLTPAAEQALPDPRGDGAAPFVRTATKPWVKTSVKSDFAQLREQLTSEELSLLSLRVGEDLAWMEIARRWPREEGDELSDPDVEAEKRANRLKKRFERLKVKLKDLAEQVGLFGGEEKAGL